MDGANLLEETVDSHDLSLIHHGAPLVDDVVCPPISQEVRPWRAYPSLYRPSPYIPRRDDAKSER
jgi:hypothetical protein